MRLITAAVRPDCLEDVRTAAARMGLDGLTVTEAICDLARSGRDGDRRVLVCALAETIRIRTRQTGAATA